MALLVRFVPEFLGTRFQEGRFWWLQTAIIRTVSLCIHSLLQLEAERTAWTMVKPVNGHSAALRRSSTVSAGAVSIIRQLEP